METGENSKKPIAVTKKTGNECFLSNNKKLDITLLEFWQWVDSDLINNTMRGKLAEFIVAKALGIENGVRLEWATYDLDYNDTKIEVKSSAYTQRWGQKGPSNITFTIRKTKSWDPDTNILGNETKRWADVYVFCVLKHKEALTINPLDLGQWDFYVLPTSALDEKLQAQKTISLPGLLRLNPQKVGFDGIRKAMDQLKHD